ncbi:MAG: hypothetical protein ABJG15_00730 [Hyphomonadaceae bacterium]
MSKKTEKIEIRVTPEEKIELMDLARSEDRSASELIRSIVGAYMQAKDAAAPLTNKRINQMVKSPKAWGTAGIVASLSAALMLAAPAQAENGYTVNVEIYEPAPAVQTADRSSWETNVPSQSKSNESYTVLPMSHSDYEVSLRIEELEDGTTFAAFNICKKTGTECELIAEPNLLFSSEDGGRIEIGSVIENSATGAETPYDLIAIDISQNES